ncbi:hypothetical protein H312_00324 [Anncaliia algerae PRA339]|uniref:Homeobox domain-containing protein n=1 Tax=Anncaliia algerae PRA339 TaxID=1288291 RepID=A0A059F5Q3_9MICR|nr:hypothetical protein H312_00324 [Anncaliia algerae PRA339]
MKKQHKFRLTIEQREYLWDIFFQNRKPNKKMKQDIADSLGITLQFVQNWFRNSRATFKTRFEDKMTNYDSSVFLPNCNALCIQPNSYEIQKYFYVNKNGDLPVIYLKYYRELGVYYLSYW